MTAIRRKYFFLSLKSLPKKELSGKSNIKNLLSFCQVSIVKIFPGILYIDLNKLSSKEMQLGIELSNR